MRRSLTITLLQLFVALALYLGTLSTIRAQTSSNLADSLGAEDSYTELPTPERIFPTQVYERASLLRQQLETLNNTL